MTAARSSSAAPARRLRGVGPAATLALAAVLELLSTIFGEPAADGAGGAEELLQVPSLTCAPLAGLAPPLRRLAAAGRVDLDVEYARLFLHGRPVTAHPYESFYRTGQLMDATTLAEVDALLEAGGVERGDEGPHLPDHLSVELEYLSLLLRGVAGAGPGSGRRAVRKIASELLEAHLLPFARAFCLRLSELRPAPYYHAAAETLAGALALASAILGGTPGTPGGLRVVAAH